MNKKQTRIFDDYNRSKWSSIYEAYNRPSEAKFDAERMILQEMYFYNGFGYRILSKNTYNFSCAYLYDNKKDGKRHIVYHTSVNKLDFPVE